MLEYFVGSQIVITYAFDYDVSGETFSAIEFLKNGVQKLRQTTGIVRTNNTVVVTIDAEDNTLVEGRYRAELEFVNATDRLDKVGVDVQILRY